MSSLQVEAAAVATPHPALSLSRAARRPIRVLHTVGHLTRGGIENWIYQTATRMDQTRFEHSVLVLTDKDEPLTSAFRDAGIPVLACPGMGRPDKFCRSFLRVLRDDGPFDIVHAHGFSLLTSLSLLLARVRGVPHRILHAHNDLRPKLVNLGWLYRAYVAASLRLYRALAPVGIACSAKAAEWMFGDTWSKRQPPVALLIGVDLEACLCSPDPTLRARLAIPADTFVIAQVGRFTVAKNHTFTVAIAQQLAKSALPIHLLFIGDGPLRAETERALAACGLAQRCTWIPSTDQVPAIFASVVDLTILPSLHEGLGLVVVEAQAAGVPALVSDTVTRECAVAPELVDFLPIHQGPRIWAEHVLARLSHPTARTTSANHRKLMRASRFNIDSSVDRLSSLYTRLHAETETPAA